VRAVCKQCEREMQVVKIGQVVVQYLKDGSPYYLLNGDVLKCPACDTEVVTGFGKQLYHHDPSFPKLYVDVQNDMVKVPETRSDGENTCVEHGIRWDKGRYIACPLCVAESDMAEVLSAATKLDRLVRGGAEGVE